MKKLFLLALFLGSCISFSSAQLIKPAEPIDPKYLAGAVPVNEEGKVTFTRDISLAKACPTAVTYNKALHWLGQYFKKEEVLTRKTISKDSINSQIKVGINEYIVFKSTALVLDRSQMIFSLDVTCTELGCKVTMSDIRYYYEEERDPQKYKAEEWITDELCLNKKKTKLLRLNGKFRTQTIDTFDEICNSLADYLK